MSQECTHFKTKNYLLLKDRLTNIIKSLKDNQDNYIL
jgi:hypothetical protein